MFHLRSDMALFAIITIAFVAVQIFAGTGYLLRKRNHAATSAIGAATAACFVAMLAAICATVLV